MRVCAGSHRPVSIHASAWGATLRRLAGSANQSPFQFTHPHGVRPGATPQAARHHKFQFTHPHGVRLSGEGVGGILGQFQFTHPHGVRLLAFSQVKAKLPFQFTHPHGVRRAHLQPGSEAHLFQFTHPHGVRLLIGRYDYDRMPCFNSRIRMGCDFICRSDKAILIQFQFTHPHGVRPHYGSLICAGEHVSIHASAWGATPAW